MLHFLMLSNSTIEDVSQTCFAVKLADTDRQTDRQRETERDRERQRDRERERE